MTKVKEVAAYLEGIAPISFAESYDNPGLICGDPELEVTAVITCLDSTEAIVDEAIQTGANLIVAHHPIIFAGLKSLTGKTYVERTLIKAIQNNIAIYAIHTNIDKILDNGVSWQMAKKLELEQIQILSPSEPKVELDILVSNLRAEDAIAVIESHSKGAIKKVEKVNDTKSIHLTWSGNAVEAKAIKRNLNQSHIKYEAINSEKIDPDVGLGVIASNPIPEPESVFLNKIKEKLGVEIIRHTNFIGKSVRKVALCGGSGSSLLPAAIANQADIYISADFKYHEFFDADNQIVIADIGHFESEQWTIPLLEQIIQKNFSTFAVRSTKINTNPINYR